MTPKHYKPSDLLIQWAYFLEEVKPLHTSTCALFWRSVVLTPIKVLGPVGLVGLFLFALTCFLLNAWAPQYLPAGWTQPQPSEPLWPPPLWFKVLPLVIASGALLSWLGFFHWLHSLCIPVEIEGGLVRRGSCPKCAYVLIESDGGSAWECRKCHGYFVPPPSRP